MTQKNIIVCPVKGVTRLLPYDFAEIEPLLNYLKTNTQPAADVSFPKGTVTADGRLDLCKQSIGAEGCSFVVQALWNNTHIKSLLLGTDGIGNAGAGKVAQLVTHNKQLETVYLGCNLIEEEGVETLGAALEQNTTVKGLWLKRNPIGVAGAKAIARLLRTNGHLRTLDLVNTQIGLEGLQAVCEVLATENRTLERLYLGGNQINAEGAKHLAKMLRHNKTLKALLLNVNELGDEGGTVLAEVLKDNQTLQELGLASCGLQEKALCTLFESLHENSTLHSLDLGYSASTQVLGAAANQITDSVAEKLALLLQKNRTIARLNLNKTGMTPKARLLLRESVAYNTSLEKMTIDGKTDEAILRKLSQNRLQKTHINPIPADVQVIKSIYR